MYEGADLHKGFKSSNEQLFHQDRMERAAKKYNKKWSTRFRIATGLGTEKDSEDVAYDEAMLSNSEYNEKLSQEYQRWFEHFEAVRDELIYVRDNPEAAEKEGKRPMLFVMGGAMRGVYSAGQILALHQAGFGDVFKTVGGSSSGSGPAAFFAAGAEQAKHAARLFLENCTGKDFLDLKRISKIIDTSVIAKAMRTGKKFLDVDAIRDSKTEVFALATNQETQEVDILDMKTATHGGELNMIKACEASASIPAIEKSHEVNGVQYQDGSIHELPIEKIIKKYNPTSILVLPNMAFHEMDKFENSTVENMILGLAKLFRKNGSLGSVIPGSNIPSNAQGSLIDTLSMKESFQKSINTLDQIAESRKQSRDMLEEISDRLEVKVGFAFPDDNGLKNLTTNYDIFKNSIFSAARKLVKDLTGKEPDEVMI